MDTTGTLWMPAGESTMAGHVDSLFYFVLYVSIILFIIVIGLTTYFVIKYRRKNEAPTTTSGTDQNLTLEILWTAIPTVLVLFLFVWGFKTYVQMNVVPKDAMQVRVTGQKWFWSFDYDNGANSVNELVVPVDKPVKLLMSSHDVIHSFYVPNFRMKLDVLPNRYSVLWFQATHVGDYNLFCAEFCGKGHSEMIGKVRVLSETDFNEWLESGSGPASGTSLAEYGEKLYNSKGCKACHTTDGSTSVGPTFKGIWGHQVTMQDGSKVTVDENYVRESVLKPQAKIVAGFGPVMPTFQGILKPKDIDAIVAFLQSLGEEKSSK